MSAQTQLGRTAAIVAAWLAAALAGCTGGLLQSDTPAAEIYRLGRQGAGSTAGSVTSLASVAAGESSTQAVNRTASLALTIARPRAASAIDTDRIALVAEGFRFDYYAGVRWAEPAPQMVQEQLVAALADAGQFAGVFAAPARVPTELLLDIELRRFEAVTTSGSAPPTIHVQLQASLVDSRRAVRVASFVSEAAVTATENRRGAVVGAFDRASAEVIADVATRVQAAAAELPVQ